MDQATFDMSRLGDIKTGRGNLGDEMPVAVYRLLHYTVMDELTSRYGKETAEDIIRAAGFRAGTFFVHNIMEKKESFNEFVAELQAKLKEMKIGIMRIEKADLDNMKLVLTVSEDLDCSGLPVFGDAVCVYDEGFIAAILQDYTGKEFEVIEVDCWATGDRTCRFTADAK